MQARKEEVKQQIQQELAVASAQQLVTKMTENVSG
jgi:import inner membrane translocase subunit TIM13